MPTPQSYLDFELAVSRENGKYRARVFNSPGGEGTVDFTLPFTDEQLDDLLSQMGHRRIRAKRDPKKLIAAKYLGGELYKAVFVGDILRCWQASLLLVEQQEKGLRLRLRLQSVPELADLPWEFLYDPTFDHFLNHSTETPLVRFPELPLQQKPLAIVPPLRILVIISIPDDADNLETEREWENLQRATQELVAQGRIILDRLENVNLLAIDDKLKQDTFHIVHFIGHGAFDTEQNESVLLLVNQRGREQQVDGQRLGTMLRAYKSLRLVVLNVCEGGRTNRQDPFSGVAQKLLQQQIPAVVAMQFSITDQAALILSREFYKALAENYPIDAALAEARKKLFLDDNDIEWATPVLYLRAPDGVLFDLQGAPPLPPVVIPATAPTQTAKESFDEIYKQARAAQTAGDQIFDETPYENEKWQAEYQNALKLFVRARELNASDARVAYRLGQIYARLEQKEQARNEFRRVEQLLPEPANADEKRLIVQALLERALLTEPPNEKLLLRAGEIADAIQDTILLGRIEQAVDKLAHPNANALNDFYANETPKLNASATSQNVGDPNWQPPTADDFDPLGRWNIQVQDMVGSRLYVEFAPNQSFQMMQHVGLYQVPVNGSWSYNPALHQLEILGIVNTFQPFNLKLTINGRLPDGYSAMGSDGIGYVLMRT